MSFLGFFKKDQEKIAEIVPQENKMSLKERMDWRRKAASRSVVHIFETLEIISSMYDFAVHQIDERGHVYKVVIKLNKNFKFGKKIRLQGFNELEYHISHYAKSRYGILLTDIYWKSSGPLELLTVWKEAFESQPMNLYKYSDDVLHDADLPSWHESTDFGEINKTEIDAFRAAIHQGSKLPVVHINEKEYDTDLSPLS